MTLPKSKRVCRLKLTLRELLTIYDIAKKLCAPDTGRPSYVLYDIENDILERVEKYYEEVKS